METNTLNNIKDRVSILQTDLLSELDSEIHKMKAEHAAKGLLRSGNTIKFVMNDIARIVEKYHSELLLHIKSLSLTLTPALENDILEIVNEKLSDIKISAYTRLNDTASFVGKPDLYEKVLPEVEAEVNKSSQRFKNLLNGLSIELSNKSKKNNSGSKPWETELAKIWHFLVAGKRKVLTIPLLFVLIFIPALSGIINSYGIFFESITLLINKKQSVPSKDESDVFNEWIISIGHSENEKKSKEMKSEFLKAYIASGHVNYKNEAIWKNDIFSVRHPTKEGIWLVVIDAFSGESTEKHVKKGLDELAELAFSNRELTNTLGHYLYGSKVMYYSKDNFIDTYGEIVGQ